MQRTNFFLGSLALALCLGMTPVTATAQLFTAEQVRTGGTGIEREEPAFIDFDRFSPALGTLKKVHFDYDVSVLWQFAAERSTSGADELTVTGQIGSYSRIFGGPGLWGTQSRTPAVVNTSSTFVRAGDLPASLAVDGSLSQPDVLSLFTGAGEQTLLVTSSFFASFTGKNAEWSGYADPQSSSYTMRLWYEYAPATAVPEPGTTVLLATGLVALVWRRRSSQA